MNRVHNKKNTGRGARRLLALLLASGLCAPLLTSPGSAAGSSDVKVLADSTVTLWEWKRVYTQSDLPDGDFEVMLLYEDGGKQYMVDGNKIYDGGGGGKFGLLGVSLPDGVIYGADNILTQEDVSHMNMTYKGRDEQNNQPKRYYAYCDGISGPIAVVPVMNLQWSFSTTSRSHVLCPFNIQTSEIAFSEGYPNPGYVMLYGNLSGVNDRPWFYGGNYVAAHDSSTTKMGQFIMYIGKPVEYSAVTHDVTVESGQVQNVDGHVYVCPNVTITVEPGAVLSIQGNLYNNGYIYNQGDVLLQKNACIQTLLLTGDGGAIGCDGGDLILMSGARMTTGSCAYSEKYGNGFMLKNGATCTNFGTIILPANGRLETGAVLDNRKSGWLLQGYRVPNKEDGLLHQYSQSELRYSGLESTYSCYSVFIFGSMTSLYLGKDTLVLNQGTIQMNGALKTETGAEVRHEGGGSLSIASSYQTYKDYLDKGYKKGN